MHGSLYCVILFLVLKLKNSLCFGAYPSIDKCVLHVAIVVIELIVTLLKIEMIQNFFFFFGSGNDTELCSRCSTKLI